MCSIDIINENQLNCSYFEYTDEKFIDENLNCCISRCPLYNPYECNKCECLVCELCLISASFNVNKNSLNFECEFLLIP
jgi:hypothetical protein